MLNFWEWPQRDLNDTDGTIVTVSAPTSPELLHRRPRTDQRLLLAAPQALPLTEMVFRSCERAPPPEQWSAPVLTLTVTRSSELALSCEKRPALELCMDCDAAWMKGVDAWP